MPTRAFIPYTPGSGGKHGATQYTDGADTKLDSVMVLGEQHLATYVFEAAANTNTATANSHMLQVMAGSTLNLYLRRLVLYTKTLAGAATSVEFQVRRLTTAGTGGTVSSQYGLDTTDSAAGFTTMILPTAKGTEGNLMWTTTALVPTALPAFPGELKIFDLDFDRLRTKGIRIPAGTANGFALKNIQALATATYTIEFLISESPY